MDTVSRTILVIEDDIDLLRHYAADCEEAIEELGQEEMVKVTTAATYDEALNALQHDPTIRIASIDLALKYDETAWNQERRKHDDVGGMKLLKHIQQAELPVLSVVVTGETLQSYATDALQTYGVIRFFEKARLDTTEYRLVMMALLRYLDTEDLLSLIKSDGPDNYRLFLLAVEAWEQTLHFAKQAQAVRSLPQDMGAKIAALRERLLDPVTHLPTSAVTEQRLKETIIGRETGWALLQLRIRNLKDLIDTRGSQVGPLLLHIAHLAQEVTGQQSPLNSTLYVGMFGRNVFADPCIVILVLSDAIDDRLLVPMKKALHERFAESAFGFIDQIAQKKGIQQVLPELELKEWNANNTFFADFPELIDRFFQSRGDDSYA
jgi:GGDEF domain-containing protein